MENLTASLLSLKKRLYQEKKRKDNDLEWRDRNEQIKILGFWNLYQVVGSQSDELPYSKSSYSYCRFVEAMNINYQIKLDIAIQTTK